MSMFHLLSIIGGGAPDLLAQIQAMFGGGEQGVIYDFTDSTTMFQERTGASATTPSGANGPIGSLKDLSPNNNWSVAQSDAVRPLSRQGVGDPNRYGEFDGTDDMLSATFAINQPWTRVSSIGIITGVANRRVFGGPSGAVAGLLSQGTNTLKMHSGSDLGAIASPNGENLVATEITNGASSSLYKNGALNASGNVGAANTAGIQISGDNLIDAPSNMKAFRVVMIKRVLTAPERAICEAWCGEAVSL